jgi:hypothetical protein
MPGRASIILLIAAGFHETDQFLAATHESGSDESAKDVGPFSGLSAAPKESAVGPKRT